MDSSLRLEYGRVKKISLFGAIVMYILFFGGLLISAVYLYAFVVKGPSDEMTLIDWAFCFSKILCFDISFFLEAQFLRKFHDGTNPLGKAQVRRVLVVGALFAACALIHGLSSTPPEISISNAPITIVINSGDPNLRLSDIAGFIFAFCIAAILRYGNALKEDSDSIA